MSSRDDTPSNPHGPAGDVDLIRARQLRDLAYPTAASQSAGPVSGITTQATYVPTLLVSRDDPVGPMELRLGDTLLGHLPADGTAPHELTRQGWDVERTAQRERSDEDGHNSFISEKAWATPSRAWWAQFVDDVAQRHHTSTAALAWLRQLPPDRLPAEFTICETVGPGPIEISTQGRLLLTSPPLDPVQDGTLFDYLRYANWQNYDLPHFVIGATITATPGPLTHERLVQDATQVQTSSAAALAAINADAAYHATLEVLRVQSDRAQHGSSTGPAGGPNRREEPELGAGR